MPNSLTNCDGCNSKMHRACIDLPPEDDITRPKNKNIKHLCNDCCRMDDKFEELKKFLVQFVEQKLSSLEVAISSREVSLPASTQENIIAEATDPLSRKNNIIIRNLPENNDATSERREVTKILSVIQGPDAPPPLRITRIGKHTANKSRLIKVKLNDSEQAIKILRDKKKLLLNEQYKSISVLADQTPQQVKYLEEVRKVLKHRQDLGEKVTIKYKQGIPTIVPMNPKN